MIKINLSKIHSKFSSLIQGLCLVCSVFMAASVSSQQYETIDTNDTENSLMKAIVADEIFYLEKIKEELNDFDKDRALASLGTIYLRKKEYTKAREYLEMVGFSLALDKQSPVISAASYNLGMIYVHGKGIPKNYPKAFAAFARATWGSNIQASRELYVMCRDKEVDGETIRAFTKENLQYHKLGIEHPLYRAAVLNIDFLLSCESESAYIQSVFAGG